MSYPQSSPFPSENPITSSSLTEEGMHLLQAGNADAALSVLSQAVEQNPSDGVAFQYLGIARAKTGSVEGSIAALREAVRLLPMNSGVQFNLGVSLAQAKQFDEARAVLERARELDPQNPRITASLASLPIAEPSPFTTAAGDGLASVGGGWTSGGLATVGGGAPIPPLPPAAPVLAPTYEPQNTWQPSSDSIGGMASLPPSVISARMLVREPTLSERIGRGLGWGFVHAQWWTLLMFAWQVVIYGLIPGELSALGAVAMTLVFAIVFGITGSIMGLIMALIGAETGTGAAIGIGFGILFLGLEVWLGSARSLFNIPFWFFSGRYVGASLAARINQTLDS